MFLSPPGPILMCGHLGVENAFIHAALRALSRGGLYTFPSAPSNGPLSVYKAVSAPLLIAAGLSVSRTDGIGHAVP